MIKSLEDLKKAMSKGHLTAAETVQALRLYRDLEKNEPDLVKKALFTRQRKRFRAMARIKSSTRRGD